MSEEDMGKIREAIACAERGNAALERMSPAQLDPAYKNDMLAQGRQIVAQLQSVLASHTGADASPGDARLAVEGRP